MDRLAIWRLARGRARALRPQLRFCLRTTVAGLLALAVVDSFNFPLHGLWAVLTAIVVTQTSVGGSLRATLEYMIGTLGGAIYAAALGVLVPHATAAGQAFVLALAIAPLALAAAINPSFRVAPFSAVLVLLIGGAIGESPIDSAVVRVIEVALGGAVAVAVSLLVFPARAEGLALDAAGRILNQMAELLPKLLTGFARTPDPAEIGKLQGRLGEAVTALEQVTAEARRERIVPLARGPDPAPLSRMSRRLRHDLVIVGRAAAAPLPGVFADRLGPALDHLASVASAFLIGSATALAQGRAPPPLEPVETALGAYEAEIAALRKEGLTRPLTSGEAERLFALGFALEQLRGNFADLAQIIQERARGGGGR
ncbi:MAG TPA: FUSC family protein [Roseiarcus sp.]|nr:FUSC family protein [Roseiarcus sp.]